MILTAVRGTRTVCAAVADALGAPFRTDEVGECEAVLGHVGYDAVVADAGEGEAFSGAVILAGFEELVADLKADAGNVIS